MIDIPDGLVTAQVRHNGQAGRDFLARLPERAARFLDEWSLRRDGPPAHGVSALVLPVVRADGSGAALKLPYLDEETAGEPAALRTWAGGGAVRLLDHDAGTGTLLLERLDASRPLTREPDTRTAVLVIADLLARLTAFPAPPDLPRRLGDLTRAMLAEVPRALPRLPDPADRRLIEDCAAAVREVASAPGDRLLHWDLHYDNVLAAGREPWLAIDPKPLAGDPGFELLPALRNRFNPAEITWRFEAMTDLLGLDRERARAWTLGRVLQDALWDLRENRRPAAGRLEIARRLRKGAGPAR
ncbi:aminoglycoside phosphotransferase family protein [Streptomyces sp. NPDC005423]|uniref:aminoglycoside phosphotransferase family protein n=1 Tax=Streptomyces sp. NPDC005423 TaxID=3155343 RepID=UPI0033A95884